MEDGFVNAPEANMVERKKYLLDESFHDEVRCFSWRGQHKFDNGTEPSTAVRPGQGKSWYYILMQTKKNKKGVMFDPNRMFQRIYVANVRYFIQTDYVDTKLDPDADTEGHVDFY